MTFEEFWMQNRDRYRALFIQNPVLAIHTAAEEAWEIAQSNTDSLCKQKYEQGFIDGAKEQQNTGGPEKPCGCWEPELYFSGGRICKHCGSRPLI